MAGFSIFSIYAAATPEEREELSLIAGHLQKADKELAVIYEAFVQRKNEVDAYVAVEKQRETDILVEIGLRIGIPKREE